MRECVTPLDWTFTSVEQQQEKEQQEDNHLNEMMKTEESKKQIDE